MLSKVVYSVKKSSRYDDFQISGIGYINDTDLITAGISKNGKTYVRIFQNCLECCHQVAGKQDEFKGTYEEYYEVDNETRSTSYDIWYKTGGLK